MTIRETFKAARERAGLSQERVAELAGWNRAHVSRFESGKREATSVKLDAWLEACGASLVVVPDGTTDLRELEILPHDLRELLIRLGRVMPLLSPDQVDDLRGSIERWERRAAERSPAQDRRAV